MKRWGIFLRYWYKEHEGRVTFVNTDADTEKEAILKVIHEKFKDIDMRYIGVRKGIVYWVIFFYLSRYW